MGSTSWNWLHELVSAEVQSAFVDHIYRRISLLLLVPRLENYNLNPDGKRSS